MRHTLLWLVFLFSLLLFASEIKQNAENVNVSADSDLSESFQPTHDIIYSEFIVSFDKAPAVFLKKLNSFNTPEFKEDKSSCYSFSYFKQLKYKFLSSLNRERMLFFTIFSTKSKMPEGEHNLS